jgi:hypothetical protein
MHSIYEIAEQITAENIESAFVELSNVEFAPGKRLEYLLSLDAQVIEGYTIGQHTEMVFGQFLRYFSECNIPDPFDSIFKTLLLLHDIGKGCGPKVDQHLFTMEIIDSLNNHGTLGLDPKQCATLELLLKDDETSFYANLFAPMYEQRPGSIFRPQWGSVQSGGRVAWEIYQTANQVFVANDDYHENALKLVTKFINRAETHNVKAADYFFTALRYFQIDTSAYTHDARSAQGVRGLPALDYIYEHNDRYQTDQDADLFVYEASKQRLLFEPRLEAAILKIEEQFVN